MAPYISTKHNKHNQPIRNNHFQVNYTQQIKSSNNLQQKLCIEATSSKTENTKYKTPNPNNKTTQPQTPITQQKQNQNQ